MTNSGLSDALLAKIEDRTLHIGIIGLGYVGLPLAMEFTEAGFPVLGYDTDADYVASVRGGTSTIIDVSEDRLSRALETGRFVPTSDEDALDDVDAYLICVPTPLSKSRQPDLSYVESAISRLTRTRVDESLVVLESTTYPGTTVEVLRPALESSGARLDASYFLAFSPERVDPGNARFSLGQIPKVVGGASEASTDVAAALYRTVFESVHLVSNPTTAELAKLLENTFRNVNIALANEMKMVCDALDVDIWEVIEAAATKPFGFMPFYPGPGVGGHCIPLDPQYLVYRARLAGFEPRLVAVADQINQDMSTYTVHEVMDELNDAGRSLRGAKVAVFGVTYKPNVPDTRESPALIILDHLIGRGADIRYVDPFAPTIVLPSGTTLTASADAQDTAQWSDVALVLTRHDAFDLSALHDAQPRVVDTRGSSVPPLR